MAMALVSILVAAIFSVALNNLYGLKRDREARQWTVRQQHLVQLRPVLKQESDQIARRVADNFHRVGFLEPLNEMNGILEGVITTPSDLVSIFEPNLMSFDLANHYPEYAKSKKDLEPAILNHDRNFSSAVAEAQKELGVHDISLFSAEVLAKTFVVQCMGRGQGFTLTKSGFSVFRLGVGISGQLPSDVRYAYQHYQAFKPSSSLQDACNSLRASADSIEKKASDLSKTAQMLGQETTLRGDCPFVKPE
jgi:hypothetical protein